LFTGAHHFGPVRQNIEHAKVENNSEIPPGLYAEGVTQVKDLTYEMMKKILTADHPGVDLVFSKEFAYCLPKSMWEGWSVGNLLTLLLIHEPESVLYSNYKAPKPQPCVQPPSGGLYELYEFYQFVKEKKGTIPIVVDAAGPSWWDNEELLWGFGNPIWSKHDIFGKGYGFTSPFIYHAIWGEGWIVDLKQSTGFIKIKQKPVPLHELPSKIVKCIEEYHMQDCIKPSPL